MRVAIISDIHANLEALRRVEAELGSVDAIWCLGDVVGYGPDPSECVDWVRHRCAVVLSGNHDWAAIGKLDPDQFNDAASAAALWTAKQLGAADRAYLESLASRAVENLDNRTVTLAHGSPRDPIWEYLSDPEVAAENFAEFSGVLCLVGHTHVPMAFALELAPDKGSAILRVEPPAYQAKRILAGARRIANVGSVGQPRDGDPSACCAFLDTTDWTLIWKRVRYDVGVTQRRMRSVGLPDVLWMRLAYGR